MTGVQTCALPISTVAADGTVSWPVTSNDDTLEDGVTYTAAEYVVDIAKGYYIIRIGDTVRKVAIR